MIEEEIRVYLEQNQKLHFLILETSGAGRMDFNDRKREEFLSFLSLFNGLEIGGLAGYWRARSVVCIFKPSFFTLSFAVVLSGFDFV